MNMHFGRQRHRGHTSAALKETQRQRKILNKNANGQIPDLTEP